MSSPHEEWIQKQELLQAKFNLIIGYAVEAWIMYYKSTELPTDEEKLNAPKMFCETVFKSDIIFRGEAPKGVIAGMFNDIAQSLAVMAFDKGGIEAFGYHWKA